MGGVVVPRISPNSHPRASGSTGLPRTTAPGRVRDTAELKSNYSGAGLINSLLTAFALSQCPGCLRNQEDPPHRTGI